MNNNELWQSVLAQVQLQISKANFATWFQNTEITAKENEKIIIISTDETEIDISQYIYEFITFAIPFKKAHPQGKCNKESLKKLNEIKSTEKKKTIDPRWQELLKIKLS